MQKRIAVLVSGGGTNLQALIDAQARGEIVNGSIAAVISSKEGAFALERAAKAGIPGYVIARKDFTSNQAMTAALVEKLKELDIDLVVLAGFMVILTEEMVRTYPNAILNVHPALIPSFCGPGYYGLHVHEKALEYGIKLSGATVHFVSESATAVPSCCKRPFLWKRATPPKRSSAASWSRLSGSSCPGRSLCSVRTSCPSRAGPCIFSLDLKGKPTMKNSFLLSSGFLFIGGALLAIISSLRHSDPLWALSVVLMLMGGISLVCFWCRDLFMHLPDDWKAAITSDNVKKEDKTDENA